HGEINPGADDNASGVAGILEIARLIAEAKPKLTRRLDLVAYTLEENSHLKVPVMGSFLHAQSLKKANADIALMISVEMIGFYSDEANSQRYPLGFLDWFYPDRANFIGVVGLAFDRGIVARTKSLMQAKGSIPVYSINAPRFIPHIGRSDHANFWHFGLPALMVTDTSFLRNPHYHKASDKPETLDFGRMKQVVDGLYRVAVSF
ncbi:MAG: M28 family peptidase, partial [Gammaproteobacteria bacterium]|nr:M28 family peptidase [Gammaproteobacteria bacterium]